jgi:hypothetical protein
MSGEICFVEKKHENQENSMKRYLVALCSLVLGANALAARDFKATNCEIFIDKVAGQQVGYHGAFGAIIHTQVFLKIDLSKTGPVRKVVFYSNQRAVDKNGSIKTESGFREVELSNYFGAADYFIAGLGDLENHWWDSDSRDGRAEHEGAFYVERLDGVRLWVNPATSYGPHFLFNEDTADTLSAQGQIYSGNDGYPYGAAKLRHLNEVKQTADYNTYWNPSRCR